MSKFGNVVKLENVIVMVGNKRVYGWLDVSDKKIVEGMNVSDSIRYLDARGYDRAGIAELLGKRYQHVRNVLINDIKFGFRGEGK